jgi:hypothetical protein
MRLLFVLLGVVLANVVEIMMYTMVCCRSGPEAVPVKYPGLESSYSSGYQAAAAPRYAAPRGPSVRPPMMRGGYHM